jgi:hypothetical protein
MKKVLLKDLPERLRQAFLDTIPRLRGREPDTLVRVLRPADGFFQKPEGLRDDRRPTVAFATVPWELDTSGGAIRLDPFEPVLIEPQPNRRTLIKAALGTAAVAVLGVTFFTGNGTVRAEGLLQRFRSAGSAAARADILSSVQGSKTQEARDLYVHILLNKWPAGESEKLVKDALCGLESAGDQLLYTLACYYALYCVPVYDIRLEAIYRLAMLKDPLIRKHLPDLRKIDPMVHQEAVKLLNQ